MIQEATDTNTSSIRLEELAHTSIELARLVATNLAAPPELLTELASSSDKIIRQNVTANPNTPTEVLFKLGEEFPEQFIDNPIFSLLFLENPNLVQQIPWKTLMIWLKNESTPLSFLQLANGRINKNIQEAVRLHINWSGEISANVNEAVWEEIHRTHLDYRNTNFASRRSEWGALYYEPHLIGTFGEFEPYAFSISIPECILQQLSNHFDKDIQNIFANYLNTHIYLLVYLLARNYYSNETEILEIIDIANNPKTPVHILEQLLEKYDGNKNEIIVILSLARNPNTPAHILEILAQDEDINVRRSVAQHPNTAPSTLQILAQDEDMMTRYSVVRNPDTCRSTLEMLMYDKDPNVKNMASWKLHRLRMFNYDDSLDDSLPTKWRLTLRGHPHKENLVYFSKKCLDYLSEETSHSFLRFIILLSADTPSKILAKNSNSLSWVERFAITQNSNVTPDVLQTLAKDGNRIVRAAAKANLERGNG